MLITYDKKVLDVVRKIASSPTALQKDLMRFIPECEYLAPQAKEEFYNILHSLPRRKHRNK